MWLDTAWFERAITGRRGEGWRRTKIPLHVWRNSLEHSKAYHGVSVKLSEKNNRMITIQELVHEAERHGS